MYQNKFNHQNKQNKLISAQNNINQQIISHKSSRNQQLISPKSSKYQSIISPTIFKNQQVISPRISRNISKPDQYSTQITKQTSSRTQSSQIKSVYEFDKYPCKKLFPLLIKQIIHELYLRKFFQIIKNSIKIQKISLQLLLNKSKRNINDAFLKMKFNFLEIRGQKIQSKYSQLKKPKLIGIFLCKFISKIKNYSFNQVIKFSQRKLAVFKFVNKLQECTVNFVKNQFKRTFIIKLKLHSNFMNLRNKYLQKINIYAKKSIKRYLSLTFCKILNFSIFIGYQYGIEQRKRKNKQIVSLSSSRKTIVTEQKQKLKKLKHSFDSINLQKNRSLNQLKKSRTGIKQQMNIDIRQMQRQQDELQQQLSQTQQTLQFFKRQLSLRQQRKLQAQKQDYVTKVMNIYSQIQFSQKQQIKITQNDVLNSIIQDKQLQRFQTKSTQCYFYQNLYLLELIHLYEKVRKLQRDDMDSEYLQRLYQNNDLKSMVGILVKRQIEKSVHGSIITFSKQMLIQSNFSPIKTKSNNFSQQSNGQANIQIIQKPPSLLPYSSKQSSNTSNPIRLTGKISSRATYFNN